MGQTNTDYKASRSPVGTPGSHGFRNQFTREREKAVFGEANFEVLEGLKASPASRLAGSDGRVSPADGRIGVRQPDRPQ